MKQILTLLWSLSALSASVTACSSSNTIKFCRDSRFGPADIEINEDGSKAIFIDIYKPVTRCLDSDECMLWPFPISKPPKLPMGDNVVKWHHSGVDFLAKSKGDDYEISAKEGQHIWTYAFNGSEIRKIQLRTNQSGSFEQWVLCAGSLNFNTISRLAR